MIEKTKVQEAIGRIDNALAQLNINRQAHIILTNDLQLVQAVCMDSYDNIAEKKDGGTNIIPIRPESNNEDKQGSGDSV